MKLGNKVLILASIRYKGFNNIHNLVTRSSDRITSEIPRDRWGFYLFPLLNRYTFDTMYQERKKAEMESLKVINYGIRK